MNKEMIINNLAGIYARTRFARYLKLDDVDPTSEEAFEFLFDCYKDAYRTYASLDYHDKFESLELE